MAVITKLNYLRISPRKVRLVADLIRKDNVKHAEQVLNFTIKKAALPMTKLLKSAVAVAQNNFHLEPEDLYISKIFVNEGPKYKRWRPRSRGMANQIRKRTSHIVLVLDEIKNIKKNKKNKIENKRLVAEEKKNEKKENIVKDVKKNVVSDSLDKNEIKIKKSKVRKEQESLKQKPKDVRGFKKIFRRKAF